MEVRSLKETTILSLTQWMVRGRSISKATQHAWMLLLQQCDQGSWGVESQRLLTRVITYYSHRLTPEIIEALLPSCAKELSLPHCTQIREDCLEALIQRCTELQTLDLTDNAHFNLDSVQLFKSQSTVIYTNLLTVVLEDCTTVCDHHIQALFKNAPHIQNLNIAHCNITDHVFLVNETKQLAREACLQLPKETKDFDVKLHTVDLSRCASFSSTGVRHLCSLSGPTLRSVNVSWTKVDCTALLYLSGLGHPAAVQFYLSIDFLGQSMANSLSYTLHEFDDIAKQVADKWKRDENQRQVSEKRAATKSLQNVKSEGGDFQNNLGSLPSNIDVSGFHDNLTIDSCEEMSGVNLEQCESKNCIDTEKTNLCGAITKVEDTDMCGEIVDIENTGTCGEITSEVERIFYENKRTSNPGECIANKRTDLNGVDKSDFSTVADMLLTESFISVIPCENKENCDENVFPSHEVRELDSCVCDVENNINNDSACKDCSLHKGASNSYPQEECTIPANNDMLHDDLHVMDKNTAISQVPSSFDNVTVSETDVICEFEDQDNYGKSLTLTDGEAVGRTSLVDDKESNTCKTKLTKECAQHFKFHALQSEVSLKGENFSYEELKKDELEKEDGATAEKESRPNVQGFFTPKLSSLCVNGSVFKEEHTGLRCLHKFLTTNSELSQLKLYGGMNNNYVTDNVLNLIGDHGTQLTKLSLEGCDRVTDLGLSSLVKCKLLNDVEFTGLAFIQDTGIALLVFDHPFTRMLMAESQVTNTSLYTIAVRPIAKTLRELDLSWCEDIEDDLGLNKLVQECTSIERLMLRECPFTATTIASIAKSCQHLTQLSIASNMTKVLDESVILLSEHLPLLEIIDLGWNIYLTNQSIQALMTNCSRLIIANLEGLKQITSAPFLNIIAVPETLMTYVEEWVNNRIESCDGDQSELTADLQICDLPCLPCRSTTYCTELQDLMLKYSDLVEDIFLQEIVAVVQGSIKVVDYYGEEVEELPHALDRFVQRLFENKANM